MSPRPPAVSLAPSPAGLQHPSPECLLRAQEPRAHVETGPLGGCDVHHVDVKPTLLAHVPSYHGDRVAWAPCPLCAAVRPGGVSVCVSKSTPAVFF